jgi:hypothetical protein
MEVKFKDEHSEGKWHGLLMSLLIDFDWSGGGKAELRR